MRNLLNFWKKFKTVNTMENGQGIQLEQGGITTTEATTTGSGHTIIITPDPATSSALIDQKEKEQVEKELVELYSQKLKQGLKNWKIEAPELGHVRPVPLDDAHINYIINIIKSV